MDLDDSDLTCLCGRAFGQQNALSKHRRSCVSHKRHVSAILLRTKEFWEEEDKTQCSDVSCRPTKKPRLEEPIGSTNNSALNDSTPHHNETIEELPAENHPSRGPREPDTDNLSSNLAIARRKPSRQRRLPKRYRDIQPESVPPNRLGGSNNISLAPTEMPEAISQSGVLPSAEPAGETSTSCLNAASVPHCHQTNKNSFQLICRYRCPSNNHPPNEIAARMFGPSREYFPYNFEPTQSNVQPQSPVLNPRTPIPTLGPYPNLNSFLLGEWYWAGGAQKSQADFQRLIQIVGNNSFLPADVCNTRWARINQKLATSIDEANTAKDGHLPLPSTTPDASWKKERVTIEVPFNSCLSTLPPGPKEYFVGDFYRRSIVSVIKERLARSDASDFHFDPYELVWKPNQGPPLRVYGELYNSKAFLDEHEKIQDIKLPEALDSDVHHPRAIAALMFSSDETHLTQFGETKLWPLYLFFGNDSKYMRCRPSHHLGFHVAYFVKPADSFKEFCHAHTGKKPRSILLAHCLKETLHAQWKILLDDEFLDAYRHGVVITCMDNIQRRLFPRIFTYSMDYPEKVTLSTIRNSGCYPCPRCLVPKTRIHNLGMPKDRWWRSKRLRHDNAQYRARISSARSVVYCKVNPLALDTKRVGLLLDDTSLVPTESAFSTRLSPLGFDFFAMFTIDLMHEIESGNWRAIFIHLLRIMNCQEGAASRIIQLNSRYRQIPTFGTDTIRKFRKDSSEMRKLAARDWENMLQCAIPVFESLVEENSVNELVLDVLFTLANWHGFAKLRMHTDATLQILDQETTNLGNLLRRFKVKTEQLYDTRELPKETRARARRVKSERLKNMHDKGTGEKGKEPVGRGSGTGTKPPKDQESITDPGHQKKKPWLL